MGKKNKKQKEDKQEEVGTKSQTIIYKLKSKTCVANEISKVPKRTKKSQNMLSHNNIESNENAVIKNKKNKIIDEWNVAKIQDQTSNNLVPGDTSNVEAKYDESKKKKKRKRKQSTIQDEANNEKLFKEVIVDSDKQKHKKIKQNIDTEVPMEHSSEKSMVGKKNKKKIRENVNDVNTIESQQETLNISNKTNNKKTKQNKLHNEEQETEQKTNNNQEKSKKKKKRKIIEEEVVDDEIIDRYCDELDDFHNKQYENWVKLIEENLNKSVKNYLMYSHFSSLS